MIATGDCAIEAGQVQVGSIFDMFVSDTWNGALPPISAMPSTPLERVERTAFGIHRHVEKS